MDSPTISVALNDAVREKFTGKERDTESGLDYFGARYYWSGLGRFTSPDPLGINLIRVLNPQRLNKYAYVVNNPFVFTDPDGKDAVAVVFKMLAGGAGHAAVISVHPDGSATFGSYGSRGGGKPVWPGESGSEQCGYGVFSNIGCRNRSARSILAER